MISDQTARHDLKTLRTAVNWYHREHGPLPSVPVVTLPHRAPQKQDYWLTRSEVAARIRAARMNARTAHVARQLLIGVYTGTRPGAILKLMWMPSPIGGWFDLDAGVLHRRGMEARRTKKRQLQRASRLACCHTSSVGAAWISPKESRASFTTKVRPLRSSGIRGAR